MKKVGIVTICDYKNYGNRLQNYAVQEILRDLGFDAETIVNMPLKNSKHRSVVPALINKYVRLLCLPPREVIRLLLLQSRKAVFVKWMSRQIKETTFTVTPDYIPNDLGDSYDYFVVGSDQVWNPAFRYGFEVDFLTFAPKHKRIAYAASFGESSLPREYVGFYKQRLAEMKALSVRESVGRKLIKDLTGREAVVLIDPTMMLSKEKWLSIAKSHNQKPKTKYLLSYFLGDISKEVYAYVKRIARQNNLEIVTLESIKDRKRFTVDPSEFIDYVNEASVVFTNSFHGTVFSILFEKLSMAT